MSKLPTWKYRQADKRKYEYKYVFSPFSPWNMPCHEKIPLMDWDDLTCLYNKYLNFQTYFAKATQ